MSSSTVLAATEGCTSSTFGAEASRVTAVKSFSGLENAGPGARVPRMATTQNSAAASDARTTLFVRQPVRIPPDEVNLAFLGLLLLAIQAELLDHRGVAYRVHDRVLAAVVAVLVPVPARHAEHVVRPPVDSRVSGDGVAATLDTDVDGIDVLPVRLRLLARPQELRADRHGRPDRAAGRRVDELDDDAVVGTAGLLAQAIERVAH